MGVNDYGVAACVLNRPATLGPAPDKRSRGELPLEALDHAEASAAAEALAHLDPAAYRPFNMLVADAREAYWIAARTGETKIHVAPVAEGLSMLTAHDLNDDEGSARQRHYRQKFARAAPPNPESGDWESWRNLLESPETGRDGSPESAMLIQMKDGFATTSSSLIALPRSRNAETSIIWLFRGGLPGQAKWDSINGL